jgi:hypothetical protein
MIIHKGERFIPAEYRDEVELEHVVYANLANMFGDEAINVPLKTKLRTDDDVETIPDAIILDFMNDQWYIVEVELAAHSTHDHVLPQVTKMIIAVSTPGGKERLIDAVFRKIEKNPGKRRQLREQGMEEFKIKDRLEQLVKEKDPIFAIPIDEIPRDLETWERYQKYIVNVWQIKKYLPIDQEIEPLYVFPERTTPSLTLPPRRLKHPHEFLGKKGVLFDLISAGGLVETQVLFLRYKTGKGKTHEDVGEVTKYGWILVDGHRLSPTLAAKYCYAQQGVRGKAVDGWREWVDGEEETLEKLRDEFLRKK